MFFTDNFLNKSQNPAKASRELSPWLRSRLSPRILPSARPVRDIHLFPVSRSQNPLHTGPDSRRLITLINSRQGLNNRTTPHIPISGNSGLISRKVASNPFLWRRIDLSWSKQRRRQGLPSSRGDNGTGFSPYASPGRLNDISSQIDRNDMDVTRYRAELKSDLAPDVMRPARSRPAIPQPPGVNGAGSSDGTDYKRRIFPEGQLEGLSMSGPEKQSRNKETQKAVNRYDLNPGPGTSSASSELETIHIQRLSSAAPDLRFTQEALRIGRADIMGSTKKKIPAGPQDIRRPRITGSLNKPDAPGNDISYPAISHGAENSQKNIAVGTTHPVQRSSERSQRKPAFSPSPGTIAHIAGSGVLNDESPEIKRETSGKISQGGPGGKNRREVTRAGSNTGDLPVIKRSIRRNQIQSAAASITGGTANEIINREKALPAQAGNNIERATSELPTEKIISRKNSASGDGNTRSIPGQSPVLERAYQAPELSDHPAYRPLTLSQRNKEPGDSGQTPENSGFPDTISGTTENLSQSQSRGEFAKPETGQRPLSITSPVFVPTSLIALGSLVRNIITPPVNRARLRDTPFANSLPLARKTGNSGSLPDSSPVSPVTRQSAYLSNQTENNRQEQGPATGQMAFQPQTARSNEAFSGIFSQRRLPNQSTGEVAVAGQGQAEILNPKPAFFEQPAASSSPASPVIQRSTPVNKISGPAELPLQRKSMLPGLIQKAGRDTGRRLLQSLEKASPGNYGTVGFPALNLPVATNMRPNADTGNIRSEDLFRQESCTPSQVSHLNNHTVIERRASTRGLTPTGSLNSTQSTEIPSGSPVQTSQGESEQNTDLKALAREIYPLIKRMIIVERERLPF